MQRSQRKKSFMILIFKKFFKIYYDLSTYFAYFIDIQLKKKNNSVEEYDHIDIEFFFGHNGGPINQNMISLFTTESISCGKFLFSSHVLLLQIQEGLTSRTFYRLANTKYALLHTRLVPPLYLASILTLSCTTAILPFQPSGIEIQRDIDVSIPKLQMKIIFYFYLMIKTQLNCQRKYLFASINRKSNLSKLSRYLQ